MIEIYKLDTKIPTNTPNHTRVFGRKVLYHRLKKEQYYNVSIKNIFREYYNSIKVVESELPNDNKIQDLESFVKKLINEGESNKIIIEKTKKELMKVIEQPVKAK